ncbi:S41 family peptidase [Bacteroides helcogenes]|uniref:C-terminal processing peptidase-3 n=1 Tax=Bacteroides helcogenes (strain ATCC 35417 / DSM 20613 / JCM 6297 / CCUG 15421 / P 36-108) TaxID=693979 RepID=E6SPE6_BACT6|nr:S41 family peptidase [Bacteroides helcogenes]ADV42835.1 C-terminal processing peptidase-3 [Bacteroides helcogenes P 36-108]MDY5239089.1 S41 family peptidase [Bacteroides helcogenes]
MRRILFIIICICAVTVQAQKQNNEALRKLQMAEFFITNLYVDKVDENKLVEEAIIKMLAQLDPHSTYNNAEEVKKMNEPLQGNFEGIGVQFQMIEDTLLVIQPVTGGPSERVGILAGDRIVSVNDSAIAGVKMSTEDIMSRLRGPKNSEVKLTVVRRGVDDTLYFTVKRDKIPIFSLDAAYMIQPQTGYIRINRFAATTAEEFTKALKELQKKGMTDLILDLQGNGGGYLNAAIDLANEFLGQKELIVYTEGRTSHRSDFFAKGNGNFKNGRLIVLVDEYSASASEIVTGAIQDWDRGVVVGRRTFGKGLVQRPIDLPDGSMIRLTIARYYTPAGRCIQKPYDNTANLDGTPGNVDGQERYNSELANRFNHGEMIHADSIHFADSLKVLTKRLKRTVYGGGGIMPDFFVPIDTTQYTDYHRNLVAKGVIIRATTGYIEKHRKELQNRYKKFETFNDKFEIDNTFLTEIHTLADKEKIKFDEKQYNQSLPLIKTQLKALIARDLWDMNEYFRVMNGTNKSVQQALEILNKNIYSTIIR